MRKKMCLLIILLGSFLLFNNCVNAKTNNNATGATFSCSYNRFIMLGPTPIQQEINIDFKVVGDAYYMEGCTYKLGKQNSMQSCSDYTFYDGGNYKSNLNCPSSMNVNHSAKTITWVANDGGSYKHPEGTKTNYKESSTRATCLSYHKEETCVTDPNYACVWDKKNHFCNTDNLLYVNCQNTHDIPVMVPQIFSFVFNLLKIATPIVLVIISIITLLKALAASKEDEIKKAQNSLIRKLIAAALIFFIASIVQFVILKVADDTEGADFMDCLSCFLNNDCSSSYFKTNIQGTEYCSFVKDDHHYPYLCDAIYRSFKNTKDSEICGDINGDYFVNNKDLTKLQQYITGKTKLSSQQLKNANVNGDNTVDEKDVKLLLDYSSNNVKILHCNGLNEAEQWIFGE